MALLTRYVNHAIVGGNDDGTTEADAWTYLYQAMGVIKTDAGTNNFLVYVKSGESYGLDDSGSGSPDESDDADHDGAGGDAGAIIYIDQLSPGLTTSNTFEGYTATPGDGGVATLDCNYQGADKLTNGINYITGTHNWVIKNFDIINASGDGVEGGGVADNLTFKNVRVKACAGMGWNMDNNISLENCIADGNTIGFDGDLNCILVSCIFRNNSSNGFFSRGGTAYNCLAYDNGDTDVMYFDGMGNVFGCTIDGNEDGGRTASNGIRQDSAVVLLNIVNTIVYDCAIGVLADGDAGDLVISRNNLFNGNSDDASGFQTEYNGGDGAPSTGNGVGNLGHVTGAPGFTGTYLPGSNAQNAALDHQYTNNFWASFDGANNPPEPENE